MKTTARHRSHSIAFKRRVVQKYLSGETLHGLAKRHDLSRILVRVWVQKYEAGALDDDAAAADTIQAYEARIAALERPRAVRGATRPADGQNRRLTVPTHRGPVPRSLLFDNNRNLHARAALPVLGAEGSLHVEQTIKDAIWLRPG